MNMSSQFTFEKQRSSIFLTIDYQQYNNLMNRSIKPISLTKRKSDPPELPSNILKCNGLFSAYSLKNHKILETQIHQKILLPQSLPHRLRMDQSIKQMKSQIQQTLNKSCGQEPKQQEEEPLAEIRQRKNLYRSRNNKRSSLSKNKPPVKVKMSQNSRLIMFFRNQLVSLFSVLGKRQEFMNFLRGNNRQSINSLPLKNPQIQQRLQKQLSGKGKDKTRKNFNHLTNQQLRSLKYKPKPLPIIKKQSKNKQQSDEQAQQEKQNGDEQQQQNYPDIATWKRKNGVGINQKVFIVKGGYRQLRQTLIQKGWAQNQQVKSKFFDLKWTTKICDIDYSNLKNGQIVNHFNNNHHLTSKYGITRRLRSLSLAYNVDIDKFYPRCYDLGDQNQFQNFVEGFKFSFVEGVAKRFLVDKQRYKNLQLKIRLILKILRKYTISLTQKISKINNGQFPIIDNQQWQIITQTDQYPQQLKLQKLLQLRQLDPIQLTNVPLQKQQQKTQNTQKIQRTQQYFQQLHILIQKQLQKLQKNDPQYDLNGYKNVWIAKPNFLSRGRGIRCFNNLYQIADYCLGRDVQFVIQKYIERPLLIQGKKFDIRQWVFIQDYSPPKIYFYNQCYLRFSMDNFSLDNIHNRFIHLTNNSIQKHNKSKKSKIDQSMWQMSQFAKYIGQQNWLTIQNKIKNIVVWSIKSCQNFVTAKKGSFQLVGFDFMIDQNYNPWLIEINMSPSMESSTPVTKKLVKMLLHDTGLLISSTKSKKNIGNYTCIYENQADLANFNQYTYKQ